MCWLSNVDDITENETELGGGYHDIDENAAPFSEDFSGDEGVVFDVELVGDLNEFKT